MFDLKRSQDYFWQLMQSPQGISEGAKDRGIPLTKLFLEYHEGEAVERLENYCQMYFWRLFESLREDFPATVAVLGEEAFHNIITEFLLVNPSRYQDMAELSSDLPEYFKRYPEILPEDKPFLRDLTQLEWSVIELRHAKDPIPLSKADLEKISPEQWGEIPLKLIPASRLMNTSWTVFTYWATNQSGKPAPQEISFLQSPEHLLLWRQGFQIQIRKMDELEAEILQKIQRGLSFGELCEEISHSHPDQAAQVAAEFLQGWLQKELLQA